MPLRVAVIGAGAAGMSAASRVKRLLGKNAEVVVFEKTRWVSFALCGTPYYVGCTVKSLHDLLYYPLEEFTKKRGIDVRIETEVTEVEADKRVVHWRNRKGEKGTYEYDYLVIATGAKPVAPPDWVNYENVFTLHSLDDAEAIRRYMAVNRVERVVIVGAGYVGFELAENFRNAGKKVIVLEALSHVLPRMLDEDVAQHVQEALERNGVELRLGKKVARIEGEGGKAHSVVLEDGSAVEADLIVVAIGIKPNVELAKSMGLRIGETGAIWVNEYMQTSRDEVYAVGDAVETKDLVTGDRVWMPLAPAANKMGYVAGSNIAGRRAVFPGVVKTSVTAAFDTFVAATGLTEREARAKGFDVAAVKLEGGTKSHYMPGRGRVVLKVIADRKTGRLLGAQAVGNDESAFWRINVIAALLHRGGTVWDLFYGDWGYMPRVAPVWDPLVIAGRLFMREFGEVPKEG